MTECLYCGSTEPFEYVKSEPAEDPKEGLMVVHTFRCRSCKNGSRTEAQKVENKEEADRIIARLSPQASQD